MWRSQTEAALLPEWNDGTVTWVFVRELKGEVNLPDYNVFQEINSPRHPINPTKSPVGVEGVKPPTECFHQNFYKCAIFVFSGRGMFFVLRIASTSISLTLLYHLYSL